MENELVIASVSVSVILTIILSLIYKTFDIPGKYKPWIAIILGVGLAYVAVLYQGMAFTIQTTIEYAIRGFMVGATSVGLYEIGVKPVMKKDPG